MPSRPSHRGQLLVATPALADPNFARTVVLLLEHTAAGAIGLVLNRPTPLPVLDLLPRWDDAAAAPAVVFRGGPVAPDGAIGLGPVGADAPAGPHLPGPGAAGPAPGAAGAVVGRVGPVDLQRSPEECGVGPNAARVFVGHAGWGPAQLDHELARGSWFTVPARPEDVTTADPASLWRRVLARQPGRLRIFAHFPADPGAN